MTTLLLFVLTVCSFVFYGVAGADKALILGPVYMVGYAVISMALIGKAWQMKGAGKQPSARSSRQGFVQSDAAVLHSNDQPPVSSMLWILFLVWGVAMIPGAVVSYEAKYRMLFVGAVVGAYLVWGRTLTTFKENRIWLGILIFIVMLAALYGLIIHYRSPDTVLWTSRYASYEGRLMSTYICPNHFAHLMQMMLPFCLALLFIPQSGIYLKILSGYSLLVYLLPMFETESRAGWLGSIAGVGVVVCLMALRRSRKLFAALVVLVPLCSFLLLVGAWRYSETFQRRMTPVVEFIDGQAKEGVGSESPDFRPQTWLDSIEMIKSAPLFGYGPGNYRYTFPEFRNRFQGQRIVTGHPHNEYLELISEFGLIGFGLFALAWLYGCIWILIKSLKAEEPRHALIGFAFLGAVAGTMVHSFFDFQMHVFPNAMVFAFLAAITVGPLAALHRKPERNKQNSETNRRFGADPEPFSSRADRSAEPLPAQLPTENQPVERSRSSAVKFRLAKISQLLLGIMFLVAAFFAAQIMSSAVIRSLGDKAMEQTAGFVYMSTGENHPAVKYYELALKIDPGNWRAYRGMADVFHEEWHHCLEMDKKVQLAKQKADFYRKSYALNGKDPEAASALGRSLVFLGKTERRNRIAGEGGKMAQGGQNSDLYDQALIDEGLGYLRDACSYRKFNDLYWWMLGVELRKLGWYEEALDTFERAYTIKRSASSRKNMEWLKKQLAGSVGPLLIEEKKVVERPELIVPETVVEKPVLEMDEADRTNTSLSELLDLMSE